MATAGVSLRLETADLLATGLALGSLFPPADKARIVKAALDKAIAPMLEALKRVTPLGPTGNLRRAATKKVVAYTQDGNAVALVGYTRAGKGDASSAAGGRVRAGKDRAFHQHLIEYGTQDRVVTKISDTPYMRQSHSRRNRSGSVTTVREHQVKGQGAVIASSFGRLGPFKFLATARSPDGQRVQTDPGYPRAFFRKGKKGQAIQIPAMPAGGTAGQPPLATVFAQTRTQVADILQRELRISLERALDAVIRSASGTVA